MTKISCLQIQTFLPSIQLHSSLQNVLQSNQCQTTITIFIPNLELIIIRLSKFSYNQTAQLLKLNSFCSMHQYQPRLASSPLRLQQPLISYLQDNQICIGIQESQQVVNSKVLAFLVQKDQTIQALQSQITKYKAEQIKNTKLIKQLQEKISQICPNNNNTGSNFMMASQFKQFFEDFMKNSLSTCFSPLIDYPEAYSAYTQIALKGVYQSMDGHITNKLGKICQILEIQQTGANIYLIRNWLLKILQDNWKKILHIDDNTQDKPLSRFIEKSTKYQNEEIQEIVHSEQFKQFDQKLVKICGYMILQQKKWKFIFPSQQSNVQEDTKQGHTSMQAEKKQSEGCSNNLQILQYTKKQHVCVDGWVKQKDPVVIILEGLAKQSEEGVQETRHPNLKNYVIPYNKENSNALILSQRCQVQEKVIQKIYVSEEKNKKIDQQCQWSMSSKTIKSFIGYQNVGIEQNKQNIGENVKKIQVNQKKSKQKHASIKNNKSQLSLKQLKSKFLKEESLFSSVNHEQILKPRENNSKREDKNSTAIRKATKAEAKQLVIQAQSGSLHPNRQHYSKNLQKQNLPQGGTPSITIVKSSKMKSSVKITNNLISDPSFEQIQLLPQRKKDNSNIELPLKRQTSRNKKTNSRKTSAGKIVGQTVCDSKQNSNHAHNIKANKQIKQRERQKDLNKQALYKQMIKQKLGSQHKTQRQKTRECKNKTKQEDRPLRIMHFKKIRQKYLNL